jgi:CheY-like chemotaxis protein/HPt (histidine-containing phosphotransfer) domain-containing protein
MFPVDRILVFEDAAEAAASTPAGRGDPNSCTFRYMADDRDDAPATAGKPGLHVLLAEDDAANQAVEALMLEHLGHRVDVVSDGAAAITAAAAGVYDAIILDCHMPVLDGYEAASAIRDGEASGTRVPIIGLSARGDRQLCVKAGMDDSLAKPFALSELARALERAAGPESHDGVLDPAIVDQLRMLAESASPDLLRKLQASFARDTPARLLALRAAVEAGDAEAVAFNVHALKGSAANLGATHVVATCQEIESVGETLGPAALDPLLRSLERQAADAQAALTRLAETG